MRALLVQQGFVDALKGENNMHETLSNKEKTDILEKAPNAITLSLGDKAL